MFQKQMFNFSRACIHAERSSDAEAAKEGVPVDTFRREKSATRLQARAPAHKKARFSVCAFESRGDPLKEDLVALCMAVPAVARITLVLTAALF